MSYYEPWMITNFRRLLNELGTANTMILASLATIISLLFCILIVLAMKP